MCIDDFVKLEEVPEAMKKDAQGGNKEWIVIESRVTFEEGLDENREFDNVVPGDSEERDDHKWIRCS